MRKNVRAGPAPERARRVEQRPVERLERSDRATDVEGARDIRDGKDDRSLRACADGDAEDVERAPEEAEPPERGKQREPGDGWRQHERQLDERDRERAPRNCRLAIR